MLYPPELRARRYQSIITRVSQWRPRLLLFTPVTQYNSRTGHPGCRYGGLDDGSQHAFTSGMLVSFLLHVVLIALVLLLSSAPADLVRPPVKNKTKPNRILLSPVPEPSKGGSGPESIVPPSRRPLPRYARRQIASRGGDSEV